MPIVSVRHAKTRLSRLLAQVEAGGEVTIARRPDVLKGKIVVPDDVLEPLPEDKFKG